MYLIIHYIINYANIIKQFQFCNRLINPNNNLAITTYYTQYVTSNKRNIVVKNQNNDVK